MATARKSQPPSAQVSAEDATQARPATDPNQDVSADLANAVTNLSSGDANQNISAGEGE